MNLSRGDAKPIIAVIGANGYVGRAAVEFFERNFAVIKYDPALENTATLEEVNACDMAVVCVSTLSNNDGSCNTDIVEEVVGWLDTPLILIKSTIPPGTTEALAKKYNKQIVFSPEFIGEGKYWTDWGFDKEMVRTPFFIFGGDKKNTSEIIGRFYAPIAGPAKRYCQTTAKTAELVKYWENAYLATKVTFANEMAKIAKAFGVDFYEARDLWALDPRVDPNHTMVFENSPGFGGKCLPKDVNALVRASIAAGYTPNFILEVLKSNARFNPNEPVRV